MSLRRLQEPGPLATPRKILSPRRRRAVGHLAEAYRIADATGKDPWEFAVELSGLLKAGATVNDLRWLVVQGYVQHAVEVSRLEDSTRRFHPSRNLGFRSRSCFVLSETGLWLAELRRAVMDAGSLPMRPGPAGAEGTQRLLPSWDANRRVLRLAEYVVKQFRVPAGSQEAILQAFEEEGWPAAIDDPLPPLPDRDEKRRLRATLQSLNENQKQRLICFRGDGSGERIVWELTAEAASVLFPENVRPRPR